MELEILETDKHFTDSPDAGEATCFCSRCGNVITEDEVPLRLLSQTGLELRYCDNCQRGMGFMFI